MLEPGLELAPAVPCRHFVVASALGSELVDWVAEVDSVVEQEQEFAAAVSVLIVAVAVEVVAVVVGAEVVAAAVVLVVELAMIVPGEIQWQKEAVEALVAVEAGLMEAALDSQVGYDYSTEIGRVAWQSLAAACAVAAGDGLPWQLLVGARLVGFAFAVAVAASVAAAAVGGVADSQKPAPFGPLSGQPFVAAAVGSCLPLGFGSPYPCHPAVEQALPAAAVGARMLAAGHFYAAAS